jgi:hypothetical protein
MHSQIKNQTPKVRFFSIIQGASFEPCRKSHGKFVTLWAENDKKVSFVVVCSVFICIFVINMSPSLPDNSAQQRGLRFL